MTLCDAGPLVAIIDRDDPHHARCVAALAELPAGGLVTTWPAFTEAMYLLGRAGGLRAQEVLWGYVIDGLLGLLALGPDELRRMRDLMRQYEDTPMDLADASLMAAAERDGFRRIFSLDRHFRVYRVEGGDALDIVPPTS